MASETQSPLPPQLLSPDGWKQVWELVREVRPEFADYLGPSFAVLFAFVLFSVLAAVAVLAFSLITPRVDAGLRYTLASWVIISARMRNKSETIIKRQQFAGHLRETVKHLTQMEGAECFEFRVEVKSTRRSWSSSRQLNFVKHYKSVVDAIIEALRKCDDRIILVIGEHGIGKTTALRDLALHLADRAARSSRLDTVLPFYVDLKSIQQSSQNLIGQDLIKRHVMDSINPSQNSAVEAYLSENYEEEFEKGRFLFIFDSFESIPEISHSRDQAMMIKSYSDAVWGFIASGVHSSRGVVASGPDTKPKLQSWTEIRILDAFVPQRDGINERPRDA